MIFSLVSVALKAALKRLLVAYLLLNQFTKLANAVACQWETANERLA